MPKLSAPLTDKNCKSKPKDKPFLLFDGGFPGLHLHIATNGKKSWRIRIKEGNKKTDKTFGYYPELSLTEARTKAGIVKQNGLEEPIGINTFKAVSEEWIEWKKVNGKGAKKKTAEATLRKYRECLKNDLISVFGHKDINDVTKPEVFKYLIAKNKVSNSLANKHKQIISMIISYAVNCGIRKEHTELRLGGIIGVDNPKPKKIPKDIRPEYRKYQAIKSKQMKLAVRLAFHVWLRSSEIMGAAWSEFAFDKKLWTVPGERMKMKRTHTVPLTKQDIEILDELKDLAADSPWVFPNRTGKTHMHRDSLSKSFRDHEIVFDPRIIRVIAGSWLKKEGGIFPHVVEVQLAHILGNSVQSAYEHDQHLFYLEERAAAMQKWSDFLDAPKY
jgi:integrase